MDQRDCQTTADSLTASGQQRVVCELRRSVGTVNFGTQSFGRKWVCGIPGTVVRTGMDDDQDARTWAVTGGTAQLGADAAEMRTAFRGNTAAIRLVRNGP